MRPTLSIVIPACNEEARIGATLRATRAFLDQREAAAPASAPAQAFEILVVDDGSRDGTAALMWVCALVALGIGAWEIAAVISGLRLLAHGRRAARQS